MVPYDRFTAVVLDACTLFPMLARDVLLTLAAHEFFSPKWSARIRDEWTRNPEARVDAKAHGPGLSSKQTVWPTLERSRNPPLTAIGSGSVWQMAYGQKRLCGHATKAA